MLKTGTFPLFEQSLAHSERAAPAECCSPIARGPPACGVLI